MGVDGGPGDVINESGIDLKDEARRRRDSTSVLDDDEDNGRFMRDSSAPKFTSSCVSEVYAPDETPWRCLSRLRATGLTKLCSGLSSLSSSLERWLNLDLNADKPDRALWRDRLEMDWTHAIGLRDSEDEFCCSLGRHDRVDISGL